MRDDTRPGRPARRAADRQPVPPAMLAAAQPGGAMLSPLDSADASFRALTAGPQPLALHAASLAAGLPDRLVPLDELRALLLHPATGARARNQVWAELVRRARSGSPPGSSASSASPCPACAAPPPPCPPATSATPPTCRPRSSPGSSPRCAPWTPTTWTASRWRPGCAGPRGGPGRPSPAPTPATPPRRRDLSDSYDAPYLPWGHPDFVLAAAVARGVLTPAQARLIGRNRLEGIPLAQIAAELGISHNALCNRRKRAEKAITEAIRGGLLSDS